jgi:septum site-determining protein MinD
MTRIIVVASGKGGVGKTFVTINLAAALSVFGKDVTVVDANITTPNVGLNMGITKMPLTLHDVLEGKITMSSAVYLHPSGVKIIPAGMSIDDLKRTLNKDLREAIIELIGKTEYIIIDSAAGLGREARLAMEAANEIVVVTNPELPAVTDALKAVEVAKTFNTKPIGIVVNKFTGDSFEMAPENVAQFLGEPVVCVIPESKFVRMAIKRRVPLVTEFPNSDTAKRMKKFAAYLIGEDYIFEEKAGFWSRIKRRISR